MRVASVTPLRTFPASSAAKLFVTGATVGPVVDGLHNQCLLQYDVLPLVVGSALHSSWTVVPLLGMAYVVLGGLLPRIMEMLLSRVPVNHQTSNSQLLRGRAIQAVLTTVLIIRLSAFLETSHPVHLSALSDSTTNLIILSAASFLQWLILDGSTASLVAATFAAVGGPLAELPFIAQGVWHYLPQACDYFPLQHWTATNPVFNLLLGTDDYANLGLASITAPCYFAVTMDAIALGRWFDWQSTSSRSISNEP